MAQTYDIENVSNTNPSPNKGFMIKAEGITISPGSTKRIAFEGGLPQKIQDLESAGDLNSTLIENINNFSAAKMTGLLQKMDADFTDVTNASTDYESVVDAIL